MSKFEEYLKESDVYFDLYDKAGAEKASQVLNQKFQKLIATAKKSIEKGIDPMKAGASVRDAMYTVMDKYQKLGARDTEPETNLVIAIEKALRLSDQLER